MGALALLSAGCITIDWDAYQEPPPPLVTECGNGQLEQGEACDDGNRVGSDGCSADCGKLEICGDGVTDEGESCDDGNTESGDGCSETCQPELCGNGTLDPGEICDDGNNAAGDGCRADCRGTEQCGDGEQDGLLEAPVSVRISFLASNVNIGMPPTLSFTINGISVSSPPIRRGAVCHPGSGSGIEFGDVTDLGLQSFELTDRAVLTSLQPTGNTVSIDTGTTGTAMLAWAKLEIQSDTYQQQIVIEDIPPLGSALSDDTQFCSGLTVDRVQKEVVFDLQLGEQCDDGNTTSLDGCSASCEAERCGDGTVQPALGESCDDGNALPFDNCPADCTDLRLSIAQASVFKVNGQSLWLQIEPDNNDGMAVQYNLEFFDQQNQLLGSYSNATPSDSRTTFDNTLSQRIILRSLLTSTPALVDATQVAITVQDLTQRQGDPLMFPIGEQTCGNNMVEGVEECDDGNTMAMDGCTSACLLPVIELRTLVASRLNDDLVLVLDGNVTEPGLDHVDVSFFDANDMELSLQSLNFDKNASASLGPFLKRVSAPDLFINNPTLGPTVRVEAVMRDNLGQGNPPVSADLVSTVCGDGIVTPLIEDCDGSANCNEHCRVENPNGCIPANVYFCSVDPRKRGGPGWFWLLAIGALVVRRARRDA